MKYTDKVWFTNKARVLSGAKPLTESEYQALMTQVSERVKIQRVTHCGKEYAKGSRVPNKGGVISSSVLPGYVRAAFVTTR